MFRRKLIALDYYNYENFNASDDELKKLVSWLEDQKIRLYAIEDRTELRDISSSKWSEVFQKYLDDLHCPISQNNRSSLIDWLLGCAIRMEYGDNVEKYASVTLPSEKSTNISNSNPLDKLDFNSTEFKAGVTSLAQQLQIPPHPDHLQVLKAISLVIRERLSKEMIEKHSITKKSVEKSEISLPLEKIDLGFETSDYVSSDAAKILRLLHIRELRELQNGVNEAIVKVQSLTANPKTDTKLGKVGF